MSLIQQKYIICKDVFLNIHDMNVVNTLDSKIISLFEYKKKLYSTLGDILHELEGLYHKTNRYGKYPPLKYILDKKYKSVHKLIDNVNDKIVKNKRRLKLKIKRMNVKDKTLNMEFKELDTDEDYDEDSNLNSQINIMKDMCDEELILYLYELQNN